MNIPDMPPSGQPEYAWVTRCMSPVSLSAPLFRKTPTPRVILFKYKPTNPDPTPQPPHLLGSLGHFLALIIPGPCTRQLGTTFMHKAHGSYSHCHSWACLRCLAWSSHGSDSKGACPQSPSSPAASWLTQVLPCVSSHGVIKWHTPPLGTVGLKS